MIVIMKKGATKEDIQSVIDEMSKFDVAAHVSEGKEKTIIGGVGENTPRAREPIGQLSIVEQVVPILKPYKLVGREFQPEDTVVELSNGAKFGGGHVGVIAGPCTVEDDGTLLATCKHLAAKGVKVMRGGAFKPRTSPYSFQGLGERGLQLLAEARDETGMAVCTEVMDVRDIDLVVKYADVIQVGARNMQNFKMLTELGKTDKPILLKRGMSATISELVLCAEYIRSEGNPNIMLCERGIRTFENAYRNVFDLNCVPALKQLTHLPIVVDPSHATGKRDLVAPMSLAGIAAGADGLIVEVHTDPEHTICDGAQTLTYEMFDEMFERAKTIAGAINHSIN